MWFYKRTIQRSCVVVFLTPVVMTNINDQRFSLNLQIWSVFNIVLPILFYYITPIDVENNCTCVLSIYKGKDFNSIWRCRLRFLNFALLEHMTNIFSGKKGTHIFKTNDVFSLMFRHMIYVYTLNTYWILSNHLIYLRVNCRWVLVLKSYFFL